MLSLKQGLPQGFLQAAELHIQRGLRELQILRCLVEAVFRGDCAEVTQVVIV
jgi:hypothetical protein